MATDRLFEPPSATAAAAAKAHAGQAPGAALRRVLAYSLLAAVAVLTLVPFLWSLTTSLKTSPEAALFPPTVLPRGPTLEAYRTVLLQAPFVRWFLNSAWVAGAVVATRALFDTMSGYAFARMRFPGREALFYVVISTLMIPAMVLIIPRFVLLLNLGLVNTLPALWLPLSSSAFTVFLMRQLFESLPRELEEAARIDGASRPRMFWQVALPNAVPALTALAIFSFQASWNNFLDAVVFISGANRESFTLPLGLAYFRGIYYTDWPIVMASSILTTLPIAAVYVFFQRYFVEGVAYTGIKG